MRFLTLYILLTSFNAFAQDSEIFCVNTYPQIGTGLGLSLAYDIVTKEHGGSLEVENTEETSLAFSIILPL